MTKAKRGGGGETRGTELFRNLRKLILESPIFEAKGSTTSTGDTAPKAGLGLSIEEKENRINENMKRMRDAAALIAKKAVDAAKLARTNAKVAAKSASAADKAASIAKRAVDAATAARMAASSDAAKMSKESDKAANAEKVAKLAADEAAKRARNAAKKSSEEATSANAAAIAKKAADAAKAAQMALREREAAALVAKKAADEAKQFLDEQKKNEAAARTEEERKADEAAKALAAAATAANVAKRAAEEAAAEKARIAEAAEARRVAEEAERQRSEAAAREAAAEKARIAEAAAEAERLRKATEAAAEAERQREERKAELEANYAAAAQALKDKIDAAEFAGKRERKRMGPPGMAAPRIGGNKSKRIARHKMSGGAFDKFITEDRFDGKYKNILRELYLIPADQRLNEFITASTAYLKNKYKDIDNDYENELETFYKSNPELEKVFNYAHPMIHYWQSLQPHDEQKIIQLTDTMFRPFVIGYIYEKYKKDLEEFDYFISLFKFLFKYNDKFQDLCPSPTLPESLQRTINTNPSSGYENPALRKGETEYGANYYPKPDELKRLKDTPPAGSPTPKSDESSPQATADANTPNAVPVPEASKESPLTKIVKKFDMNEVSIENKDMQDTYEQIKKMAIQGRMGGGGNITKDIASQFIQKVLVAFYTFSIMYRTYIIQELVSTDIGTKNTVFAYWQKDYKESTNLLQEFDAIINLEFGDDVHKILKEAYPPKPNGSNIFEKAMISRNEFHKLMFEFAKTLKTTDIGNINEKLFNVFDLYLNVYFQSMETIRDNVELLNGDTYARKYREVVNAKNEAMLNQKQNPYPILTYVKFNVYPDNQYNERFKVFIQKDNFTSCVINYEPDAIAYYDGASGVFGSSKSFNDDVQVYRNSLISPTGWSGGETLASKQTRLKREKNALDTLLKRTDLDPAKRGKLLNDLARINTELNAISRVAPAPASPAARVAPPAPPAPLAATVPAARVAPPAPLAAAVPAAPPVAPAAPAAPDVPAAPAAPDVSTVAVSTKLKERINKNIPTSQYFLGPYTKIFHPRFKNKDVAKHCTEIMKLLEIGKSVFIIGYGASGAGKTSTLVSFSKAQDEEQKDGVIVHLVNELSDKKSINSIKCTCIEYKIDESLPIRIEGIDKKLLDNVRFIRTEYGFIKEDTRNLERSQMKSLGDIIAEAVDKLREVASTPNNPSSSRSHVLIDIEFEIYNDKREIQTPSQHLFVGDFAGVENKFACQNTDVIAKFGTLQKDGQPFYDQIRLKKEIETFKESIPAKTGLTIDISKLKCSSKDIDDLSEYKLFFDNPKALKNEISSKQSALESRRTQLNALSANKANIDEKTELILWTPERSSKEFPNDDVKELNRLMKREVDNLKAAIVSIKKPLTEITIKQMLEGKRENMKNDEPYIKRFVSYMTATAHTNNDTYSYDASKALQEFKDWLVANNKPNTPPTNIQEYANTPYVIEAEKNGKFYAQMYSRSYLIHSKVLQWMNGGFFGISILSLNTSKPSKSIKVLTERFIQGYYKFIDDALALLKNTIEDRSSEIGDLQKQIEKDDKYVNDLLRIPNVKNCAVTKACLNRSHEGLYINQSLNALRSELANRASQNGKRPAYLRKCAILQCNGLFGSCFGTSLSVNKIQDKITKYITDKAADLCICIMCVVNLSKVVNNPPATPYIDLRDCNLEKSRYTFALTNSHFTKEINENPALLALFRKYIPASKSGLDIKVNLDPVNKVVKWCKYYYDAGYLSKVDFNQIETFQKSLTYEPSNVGHFENFITYIDNLNSTSVIGTMELVERIAKHNTNDLMCSQSSLSSYNPPFESKVFAITLDDEFNYKAGKQVLDLSNDNFYIGAEQFTDKNITLAFPQYRGGGKKDKTRSKKLKGVLKRSHRIR